MHFRFSEFEQMTNLVFNTHTGVAAPMLQKNIDTDAIIPSREMQRVSREGLGQGLFAARRYIDRGGEHEKLNPDFVLNQAQYSDASILLTGANMGCGSSREFAVWALVDFGIRAIIAPSFGSIFHTNCVRNGLLPIVLDETGISQLADQVAVNPPQQQLTIDLGARVITDPSGNEHSFDVESLHRQMLMEGLDSIDITLESLGEIDAFESSARKTRPWMYLR
jgi:3-isopropylmalate/(R)-2-methylmalate dehydratase small subunit